MATKELIDGCEQCPNCKANGVAVYRVRAKGEQDQFFCDRCQVAAEEPADAPNPKGEERLARAVEELAREIRITRQVLITAAGNMEGELNGQNNNQNTE